MWELPVGYRAGMRVPGRIFATESLFEKALEDRAAEQVANMATLPGIVGAACAMPDIHWGYGFPIGGVAATAVESEGVVSPGGVGFDIGCGVRLLRSDLSFEDDVKPRLRALVTALGQTVPRGTGGRGRMPLDEKGLDRVLREGAAFVLEQGAGWHEDLERIEDSGPHSEPQPGRLSERALERGAGQLGSLGAGNHFLELQVVDEVIQERAAEVMGLFDGQVCVMIHSGSRGLGHQTCTDYLKRLDRLMPSLGYELPDRQLACVPFDHEVAADYMGAMDAAGNFARANRQVLTDATRKTFARTFSATAEELGLSLVYDISHNLAKIEEHEIDGKNMKLCVHRKGATRALGPGDASLPASYKDIGQPVIVPGSMGSPSFLLVGRASPYSLASTCHGAGRAMSRTAAKKVMPAERLREELEAQGIVLAGSKWKLLAEEAPYAYKDASEVVKTCEIAELSKVVARLRPVGVVKG
ncbi:MAG TPA: RtcB family protein [Actinomycetota bacterium]|nr:RtcB family protein [Actinomycetota bacterium]